MKRNISIFVVMAAALLLSSCNRKVEYNYETYATLYHHTFAVAENVGQLEIPVLLNNGTGGDVQVSVTVTEGSAQEGVDYEVITPVNGILSFSGETDSLAVVIQINSFEGEFTGAKNFSVNIASATEGLLLGQTTNANVVIQDLDHPLAPFEGEWEGTVNFATNPPTPFSTTLKLTIDAEDETYTKMYLEGWEAHPSYKGYALPVVASYDSKTSTMYVQPGQAAWGVDGYGFVFYGFDGSNAVALELKYDASANTLTQQNYYGCYSTAGEDQGWWSLYQPGAVFTKK